jgi:hypothetical protein
MGVGDWIIKLQKSKFARRFQYEPYIIKSVEYIKPQKGEKILVVYREVDYFKSLYVHLTNNEENYFSWDVERRFEMEDNLKFDKIVFFVSTYYSDEKGIKSVLKHANEKTKIYCICFLGGNKFFEATLKITDKIAFSGLGKELKPFNNCTVVSEKEFARVHIKIVEMRCER